MNLSVVILAGGRSNRMGRDKAWLLLDGQTLLARQIELIRKLEPTEVFVSGRTDTDYKAFGCSVLTDRFPEAGPLAGIEAALHMATATLVLVLAVDMPHMTDIVLQRLLVKCSTGVGVVPRLNHHIEPLAAVYPKAAKPIAVELLNQRLRAVRSFAERCKQSRMVTFLDMNANDHGFFANWNSPADMITLRSPSQNVPPANGRPAAVGCLCHD